MIALPIWAVVCLCLPSVALATDLLVIGAFAFFDERKERRNGLRAELEEKLSPMERAFCSGEEGIEKKNIDADT